MRVARRDIDWFSLAIAGTSFFVRPAWALSCGGKSRRKETKPIPCNRIGNNGIDACFISHSVRALPQAIAVWLLGRSYGGSTRPLGFALLPPMRIPSRCAGNIIHESRAIRWVTASFAIRTKCCREEETLSMGSLYRSNLLTRVPFEWAIACGQRCHGERPSCATPASACDDVLHRQ